MFQVPITVLVVLQCAVAFHHCPILRQSTRIATNMILPDYPPPGERRNYPRPDFEGTSIAQREVLISKRYTNMLTSMIYKDRHGYIRMCRYMSE